jgi:hypothetical protein
MKFSCIFSRNKLKRRKENIVYVNGGHVITAVNIEKSSLTMEEIFPNKEILKKLIREGKSLVFYTNVNKAETVKKP